jgi:hypothetical protein
MRRTLLILAAIALAVGGCSDLRRNPFRSFPEAPPKAVSWHTTPRAIEPMRVAVLPFALAERVGKGAAECGPSLAASLRELGIHEIVLVGPEQAAHLALPDLKTGGVSVDSLLAVRDATGCDAVVMGRVEQFDGFHPVAIGLTVHLVSCADGAVLWSAQAHLDGRSEDVQLDVEGWWQRVRGDNAAAVNGWKSVLASPREFSRYLSDRLAWTLGNEPR